MGFWHNVFGIYGGSGATVVATPQSLPEDFIDFLLASTNITSRVATRVHQAMMPEPSRFPAIWFAISGKDRGFSRTHDGGTTDTLARYTFDVEYLSTGLDRAQDLGDAADDLLDGYRGTFGNRSVQAVFISDQDDEYVPRGTGGDFGIHVVAQRITIITT